jgi:hypothetical protein
MRARDETAHKNLKWHIKFKIGTYPFFSGDFLVKGLRYLQAELFLMVKMGARIQMAP